MHNAEHFFWIFSILAPFYCSISNTFFEVMSIFQNTTQPEFSEFLKTIKYSDSLTKYKGFDSSKFIGEARTSFRPNGTNHMLLDFHGNTPTVSDLESIFLHINNPQLNNFRPTQSKYYCDNDWVLNTFDLRSSSTWCLRQNVQVHNFFNNSGLGYNPNYLTSNNIDVVELGGERRISDSNFRKIKDGIVITEHSNPRKTIPLNQNTYFSNSRDYEIYLSKDLENKVRFSNNQFAVVRGVFSILVAGMFLKTGFDVLEKIAG